MLRTLPIALIFILLGIIVGLNLQATPTSSTLPNTELSKITHTGLAEELSLLQTKVARLEANLHTEIESHKKTSKQLAELQHSFMLAANTKANQASLPKPPPTDNDKTTITRDPTLTEAEQSKNILTTIGIDDVSANRILRLSEKKEMDQLYLRNTASREGWFGTEKYFEKTRELDLSSNIYREELGDEKYDQFLYEANRANRIAIKSVLSESPAENTGLQSGDYIISYDSQRVFNWSDLTSLTTNGEAGESVAIEVQRNNQVFQYYIDRGPLGIRLNSERVNPRQP